jgi:hypothetical protein
MVDIVIDLIVEGHKMQVILIISSIYVFEVQRYSFYQDKKKASGTSTGRIDL